MFLLQNIKIQLFFYLEKVTIKNDDDSSEDGWIDVSHSEDEINIKSDDDDVEDEDEEDSSEDEQDIDEEEKEDEFAKGEKRKIQMEVNE